MTMNGVVCLECRCFDYATKECRVRAREIKQYESKRNCKLFAKPERKDKSP